MWKLHCLILSVKDVNWVFLLNNPGSLSNNEKPDAIACRYPGILEGCSLRAPIELCTASVEYQVSVLSLPWLPEVSKSAVLCIQRQNHENATTMLGGGECFCLQHIRCGTVEAECRSNGTEWFDKSTTSTQADCAIVLHHLSATCSCHTLDSVQTCTSTQSWVEQSCFVLKLITARCACSVYLLVYTLGEVKFR